VSARSRTLAVVIFLSVMLVLYFLLAGYRAVALILSGGAIPILMGVAMLILPLIGVWALVRELQFGRRATRLADRLEAEGRLPEERVSVRPSGRPVQEEADAVFPKYRAEAEAAPREWQAWMRLGIVYDACGDRRRARAAIREAIALDRRKRSEESSRD